MQNDILDRLGMIAALLLSLSINGTPASAQTTQEAWHALRPLEPGDIIRTDDVYAAPLQTRMARGRNRPNVIPATQTVEGLEVRRRIPANQPLTDRDAGPPYLVKANQPVTIFWRAGTMTIELKARALESGAAGDEIRVHNPDGGRTIRATVIATGTAEIPSQAQNNISR